MRWDGYVELGEQFHQHWFAQEGDVSQDLLPAALQTVGLYQVLCFGLFSRLKVSGTKFSGS